MLLGPPMPAPYSDWRFVEGDLYDTVRRVREYDEDARIVRQNVTGHLALARWHKDSELGAHWVFAKELFDLTTDQPLTGEPDGRVIHIMRATDSRRFRDIRDWHRRVRRHEIASERKFEADIYEGETEHAEKFVHAMRKDSTHRPRAFIGSRGL